MEFGTLLVIAAIGAAVVLISKSIRVVQQAQTMIVEDGAQVNRRTRRRPRRSASAVPTARQWV